MATAWFCAATASSSRFEGRMQGGHLATFRTVVVILHPGEAQEIRLSIPPPRFEADIAYLVFKLNNVHLPALRTLQTDGFKAGEPLQLVVQPLG